LKLQLSTSIAVSTGGYFATSLSSDLPYGPQDNPDWLINGKFTANELMGIMQNHISTVGARYKDSFVCFDVVNEAVADSGNETLKPSPPWYPTIPNYVDLAFQYARAAM
jgi:endo-1,4-beta-xylanase